MSERQTEFPLASLCLDDAGYYMSKRVRHAATEDELLAAMERVAQKTEDEDSILAEAWMQVAEILMRKKT